MHTSRPSYQATQSTFVSRGRLLQIEFKRPKIRSNLKDRIDKKTQYLNAILQDVRDVCFRSKKC